VLFRSVRFACKEIVFCNKLALLPRRSMSFRFCIVRDRMGPKPSRLRQPAQPVPRALFTTFGHSKSRHHAGQQLMQRFLVSSYQRTYLKVFRNAPTLRLSGTHRKVKCHGKARPDFYLAIILSGPTHYRRKSKPTKSWQRPVKYDLGNVV